MKFMRFIINKCFGLSFLWILLTIPVQTQAEADIKVVKEALDVIRTFTNDYCSRIPLEGSGGDVKLSGKAQAKLLTGLFKKLADIGVEGVGEYKLSEYKGVLRSDLVEALKDNQNCRLKVWERLKNLLPLVEKKINPTRLY